MIDKVSNVPAALCLTKQLVVERGMSQSALEKEATAILETMGHDMNVSIARWVAYAAHKAVKQIYSEVLIHDADLDLVGFCRSFLWGFIRFQINTTIKEMPVVLLPTHRSYMDFIIISYMFFFKGVPLPAIAGLSFLLLICDSCLSWRGFPQHGHCQ